MLKKMSRAGFHDPKFEQLSGDDGLETYFWPGLLVINQSQCG